MQFSNFPELAEDMDKTKLSPGIYYQGLFILSMQFVSIGIELNQKQRSRQLMPFPRYSISPKPSDVGSLPPPNLVLCKVFKGRENLSYLSVSSASHSVIRQQHKLNFNMPELINTFCPLKTRFNKKSITAVSILPLMHLAKT